MKLSDNTEGLKPLTKEELMEIYAGESAWYWIAYGISYGIHTLVKGVGAYMAGTRWASENMPGLK